jgi:hypothetical protein
LCLLDLDLLQWLEAARVSSWFAAATGWLELPWQHWLEAATFSLEEAAAGWETPHGAIPKAGNICKAPLAAWKTPAKDTGVVVIANGFWLLSQCALTRASRPQMETSHGNAVATSTSHGSAALGLAVWGFSFRHWPWHCRGFWLWRSVGEAPRRGD